MDDWALSLADMDGVARDLQFVADACNRLLELLAENSTDLTTLEALQSAAMVRYGRCFKTGIRTAFKIPTEWFDDLPDELKAVHQDTLTLRDKHLAHAVNDWDNHIPMLWSVRDAPQESPRFLNIFIGYSGTIGLESSWIQRLRDAALTLKTKVESETEAEKERVMKRAGELPIEELERRFREDTGDIPEARSLDQARRRK
jgi:hypothetical protein